MMIKFPAPEAPPMIATTRLGTIAKHRVRKFLIHGFSLKSRNPWINHKTDIKVKASKLQMLDSRMPNMKYQLVAPSY